MSKCLDPTHHRSRTEGFPCAWCQIATLYKEMREQTNRADNLQIIADEKAHGIDPECHKAQLEERDAKLELLLGNDSLLIEQTEQVCQNASGGDLHDAFGNCGRRICWPCRARVLIRSLNDKLSSNICKSCGHDNDFHALGDECYYNDTPSGGTGCLCGKFIAKNESDNKS